MQTRFRDYNPRWQHNQERSESYWKRYAERSDSPLARTIRQAYGLNRHHDPRRNCKATRKYADKRQKKGKK